MNNPNDSVLRHYFPDDADKVLGEEEFVDTNEELLPLEYNDAKYWNLLPQQIRERMAVETDPEELRLLKLGLQFWDSQRQDIECGEPYRGEKAPDREVQNLADLIGENGKVEEIHSQGYLKIP